MESGLRCDLQLPTELLRLVVRQYFEVNEEERVLDAPRTTYKIPWHLVEPLALTSKVIRKLALELWFETLVARSPDELLHSWPEFSTWTRELHCIELGTDLFALPTHWNLGAFPRLRKLRVDFDPTQSNAMLLMRFDHPRNIAAQVQELEVYDVSWLSPMTLRLVAQSFTGLRVLRMSQDLIWCSLCNICCFATFKDHPPPEIIYDKVVGLPIHYAHFIKPLSKLEYVTISIKYGLEGRTSLSEDNENLWSGECDPCMDIMYESPGFRDEWVLKKRQLERPPALKTVIWRFKHKNAEDVVVDVADEMETPTTLTSFGTIGQNEDDSDHGQKTGSNSDE